MISKSLNALLTRTGQSSWGGRAAVVGSCVALSVPTIAYLFGAMVNCLLSAQATQAAVYRPISPWLPDVAQMLPAEMAPLAKITSMLAMVLVVLSTTALLLFFFYRQLQHSAVAFEVNLMGQLRLHARRLATTRTLSAQQTALTDCLDYHLPRVRASLSRWWRTFPRHVTQLLACVVLAMLITPLLTVLTLLATLFVVLVYRVFDRSRRTSLPVVRERAAQVRNGLVLLSLRGPLLDTVHDVSQVEKRFGEQLAHYRHDAVRSLTSSAWRIPTIVFVSGWLACLFLFILAVQILASDSSLTVASTLPFVLGLMGATVSAVRLERTVRELKLVESAADELNRFLSLVAEEPRDDELKDLVRIAQQVELEHVTLQDSNGRKLLEDVSVVFKPGQLIGVVASQSLQTHALVELLMGFGRPVSGRMLVDGELIANLKSQSLTKCAHWVASDGAIVTGSVLENLREAAGAPNDNAVQSALTAARLKTAIQKLPDETLTLITPDDDRLTADEAFRLGLARAALREASVVVIEEPELRAEAEVEEESLEAICSLVNPKTITIVLPQRLLTLRQCDVVIMLHNYRIADTGTHAELLQRNELYRHLNYLRFNPFRGN